MNQSLGTNDYVSAAIEKHADMTWRICFLYFRNNEDGEDVFQEVFLKFFMNYETFESDGHQKAWLCRVTFNKCKDLCKSFWRKRVASIEEMEIPHENLMQDDLIKCRSWPTSKTYIPFLRRGLIIKMKMDAHPFNVTWRRKS